MGLGILVVQVQAHFNSRGAGLQNIVQGHLEPQRLGARPQTARRVGPQNQLHLHEPEDLVGAPDAQHRRLAVAAIGDNLCALAGKAPQHGLGKIRRVQRAYRQGQLAKRLWARLHATGALAAKVKVDNIAALVAAGASFDSLQRIFHDQSEERDIVGIYVDSLPPAYAGALVGVDSGKVSRVFSLEVQGQPLRTKWGIAKVTERTPEGPATYDAVRENIRIRLSRELGLGAYMSELRRRTFVDIRWP